MDVSVDKELYEGSIKALINIDCKVIITSCDQHGKNTNLGAKLGVTPENCEIKIIMDDGTIWIVLFSHDFVHIFKLFRNFFLDHDYVKFSNGVIFSKKDILDLMAKADSSILKLKDIHLKCKSSDRQNVKLACELISDTTATLLMDLFPGDERKAEMAVVFSIFNKCFDLFTSNGSNTEDFWRAPYEIYLGKQNKLLNEVKWYLSNIVNIGQCRFHKGGILTINCLMKLHEILSKDYGVDSFPTAPTNSDGLECFFGRIKGMWNGKGNDINGLGFLRRSSEWITIEIMKNSEFNIFSMKPELQAIIDEDFDDIDFEYQVPEIMSTSTAKKIELEWLAGRLAHIFQAKYELSDNAIVENSAKFSSKSLFLTKSMRNSIILKPSEVWMKDIIKMEGMFCAYNGENSIRKGRGLISRFQKMLKMEFPTYNMEILTTYALLRLAIQIKAINKAVEAKKKSKMTLLGAKKTLRMAGYL